MSVNPPIPRIKVAVHLRGGKNRTNMRSEALGRALEEQGVPVVYSGRETPVKGSELVIQTGFAPSSALKDAIDRQVPYIIMEAPFFRGFYDVHKASSWGYNGLAGGAWRPTAPAETRPHPPLQPRKTEGGILIVGQKPTDHSLRGSDHVQWLLDRFAEFPEADFRPHPLMVPHGTLPPIEEVLGDYRKVIVYTSTVGVDATIEGCDVRADSDLCPCPNGESREEWLHELSWSQGLHSDFSVLSVQALSGYDHARERAREGRVEIPRAKVDGQAVCQRYYRAVLRRTAKKRA